MVLELEAFTLPLVEQLRLALQFVSPLVIAPAFSRVQFDFEVLYINTYFYRQELKLGN